jgi:hypothetical protein
MKVSNRLRIALLAGAVTLLGLELAPRLSIRGVHIVSPAQAVIGRPLTPVSVAGVARRTARRCAVGVYSC